MAQAKENYFLQCGTSDKSDQDVPVKKVRNKDYSGKALFLSD